MKRADNNSRQFVQILLLALSAFLLLLIGFLSMPSPSVKAAYLADARDVQVTIHPGMPVNWLLNAGEADVLDRLPGIGEVLAQRIIQTREQEGLYFFPEDLMAVKGIGEKTLADIMKWLEAHPEMQIVHPFTDGDK